ncbi:MAG TPA: hypothetical protein EYQ50_26100 [Verrucomicrobiales bacterium]|nr:hypothetical protein [Verrucomicrobiales bacterium]HIL69932.1 hypothetical protein [Verrucomicrobiota bacterium]
MNSLLKHLNFALLLCSLLSVRSDELRTGSAKVDITPDPSMTNWITKKPYDGILDPVFVHALVWEQNGKRLVLLGWDLVDARESAVERVREHIETETGIPLDHIMINATHNHSAPWSPTYGKTPLLSFEKTRIDEVEADSIFQKWAEELPSMCLKAVKKAIASLKTSQLLISRARVGSWLFNRRPVKEDGKVLTVYQPKDPFSLPDGLRFSAVDPIMTLLSLESEDQSLNGILCHLSCHPVSVYPFHNGISGDWPGFLAGKIEQSQSTPVMVVQGCGGNVVPSRRGLESRIEMTEFMTHRAEGALKQRHKILSTPLKAIRRIVKLPLQEAPSKELNLSHITTEVQVFTIGDLALVSLPGEPLIELSMAIQKISPFPHTLVLGYTNGYGVQYVGIPEQKPLGGYEMGVVGPGTDECGKILIDTAETLLKKLR